MAPARHSFEQEWQRLEAQIDFAAGFWLGFVFTPSERSGRDVCERVRQHLLRRGEATKLIHPRSPEALRRVLPELVESRSAACTFVVAIHAPSADPQRPSEWMDAWEQVLLRGNEQREVFRHRLRGGLVFVAHPAVKPQVRDAAPDLWTIRSLVLEPTAPERAPQDRGRALPNSARARATRLRDRDLGPKPQGSLSIAMPGRWNTSPQMRRGPAVRPLSIAARLREVENLLALHRGAEAVVAARETLAAAREGRSGSHEVARALAWLARAEIASGDRAAGLAHFREAIELAGEPAAEQLVWLREWADSLLAAGEFADAETVAARLEQASRRWLRSPRDTAGLHDISAALERVGDVQLANRRAETAVNTYREALDLQRQVMHAGGAAPQLLAETALLIAKIGDARRGMGDSAGAMQAYVEAIELDRRVLTQTPDDRPSQRSFSVHLSRLADAHVEEENWSEARNLYEKAVEIDRRLLETEPDDPRALDDLRSDLAHLAAVHRRLGESERAEALEQEFAALDRKAARR